MKKTKRLLTLLLVLALLISNLPMTAFATETEAEQKVEEPITEETNIEETTVEETVSDETTDATEDTSAATDETTTDEIPIATEAETVPVEETFPEAEDMTASTEETITEDTILDETFNNLNGNPSAATEEIVVNTISTNSMANAVITLSASELKKQIEDTYSAALKKHTAETGGNTFNGLCATYVDRQLVELGIITSRMYGDGRDQYDNYKNLSKSSGGYTIAAYPATSYSLLSSLNTITSNGVNNAYNIMIGFQVGSGKLKEYGHVVFIHGILGGTVYFSESYGFYLGGNSYSEGDAASCSISTFCNLYSNYQFEGTIHFTSAASYVISYNANGGSCSTTTQSVAEGKAIGTMPTPSFDGMNFAGWYTAPYGGTKVTSSTVPTSSMSLYARYTYDYKISFNANGGTIPGAVLSDTIDGVNRGRPGETLVVFNQSGAKVNTNIYGAEVAVDANGKIVDRRDYGDENQLTVPTGGFVLSGQAGWDDTNKCHVGGCQFVWNIFDMTSDVYISLNYETGSVKVFDSKAGYLAEIKRGKSGKTLGELPVPTRSGYIFEGWYTSASGGTKISESSTFSANTTLYAHWSSDYVNLGDSFDAYIVHVDSGNGVVNKNGNVELGAYGSNASLWTFNRNSDGTYTLLSAVDGNAMDVYNNDTENYTNVQTYTPNSTVAQKWFIQDVGTGYVFISASSGKALDTFYAGTAIGTNIDIYELNYSSAQIMSIIPVSLPTLSCGSTYVELDLGESYTFTLTKNGLYNGNCTFQIQADYSLLGWAWGEWIGDSCPITITPKQAGTFSIVFRLLDSDTNQELDSVVCVLQVNTNTYTITYDHMNGYSETVSIDAGSSTTIPTSIPFNLGYTFLGWGSRNLQSVAFAPGETISVSGDTTLCAKYKEAELISATTTFTSQHVTPVYTHGYYWYKYIPSVTTSYEIKSIEESADNYVVVYDTDYNQIGYDDDSGDGYQFKLACNMTAGQTYYIGVAEFDNPVRSFWFYIDRGYKITYNANGGSGAPSSTYVYSGDGGTLSSTIPTRNGYTFLGWATSSSATSAKYAAGQHANIDADTTLYAVWQQTVCSHSYSSWSQIKAPTCTASGTERRDCTKCDHYETRTVNALGHNFVNGTCQNCGESNGLRGDYNKDDHVDRADVTYLLWHTLFPARYPISINGDLNRDGSVTEADAVCLLWHTLFPELYPL